MVEIGDRLRLRREEMKLTQKQAGKLLEMSEPFTVRSRGETAVWSIEKMLLVRERMGLSLTWLLAGAKTGSIHEAVLCRYPGEDAERVERILRNLRSCAGRTKETHD